MDNKKKALFLTNVSGFLQQFEMPHVRILQEAGYQVHYASNFNHQVYDCDISALEDAGITIHHVNIKKSPAALVDNYRVLKEIVSIIEREQIQIIHCHNPVGGVIGRLAGRLSSNKCLKVIYTAHGFHFYKGASRINWAVFYRIERIMARFTDVLIVINKEDLKYASSFRLKPGGKVYLIPGTGLDFSKFQVPDTGERNELRKEISIGEKQFFLLSVGELNKNKNHMIIIKAISRLKERGIKAEQFHYGICGEGGFKQELAKLIREEHLEEYVSLYGYASDVRRYLAAADGFAFPTIREGLGMACIEAMAMGLPVIASDNRGTREYMRAGKTGFVCKYNDAEEFAEAIEQLLSMDPETYQRISKECQRVTRDFDIHNTNQIMRHIYEEVISSIEKCQESHECGCNTNGIA